MTGLRTIRAQPPAMFPRDWLEFRVEQSLHPGKLYRAGKAISIRGDGRGMAHRVDAATAR